ncbi:conserved hypothetical protein [Gammaproteobacteria bacterium]
MTSIRQGSKTSAADRALIVAQIDGLVSDGMPVRNACLEIGCKFVNYYRWKSEAAKALIPSAPKEKKQAGRKAKFELSEAETRRLRFWRLVKGSIPLAVECAIAEALTGDGNPYFAALRECIISERDTGERLSFENATAMRKHWQKATNERKAVVWPQSVQRACRVTAAEEAELRGKKHVTNERGTERRGNMIRTAEGDLIPWYAGAIWESDDMSLNDPFRFYDSKEGKEILGRQALFTIDAYSLHWLGCSHIGRDRDSYRAEDIASHFGDIIDQHGLPLIWRIERGRWDNAFIWGCKIGEDAEGKDIRWGGLDAIIHMRDKHTSTGKANVEGSFNLLQSIMDHGFNGQTLSIGRSRGEVEGATREMLRSGRDEDSLKKFWNITQSAEAVQQAMHLFNSRPKLRHNFANEMRVPAQLWAECVKRPCPTEERWRFLPVKTTATIRKGGLIVVSVPHYAQSFRFRVNGGTRCNGVQLDKGHEVLIAFHPGEAWQGCHVFNADTSARNREGFKFAERIGVADWMEDALQEDLYAASYSTGQVKAAGQVRREFRSMVAGTHFSGRRVSHAQDQHGNTLAIQSGGTVPPERTDEGPAKPRSSRAALDLGGETPRYRSATRAPVLVSTGAEDFNEEDELAAMRAH